MNLKNMVLSVDFNSGEIDSLSILKKERLGGKMPIFKLRLRNRQNEISEISAYDAKGVIVTSDGAEYYGFDNFSVSVCVEVKEVNGEAEWYININSEEPDILIESVDFPLLKLPRLCENNSDRGGAVLLPMNEGVLVRDNNKRAHGWFKHKEPNYPSEGNYAIFPNMVCSQMLAYIFPDCSLYIGAHDNKRGVKQIDFFENDGGIVMLFRMFTGCRFGEGYKTDFPIVFSALGADWQDSADRYRVWFEENLPPRVKKIYDNKNLPEWYSDSPLVVAYPVRGIHDMDEMKPNKLFPYVNALPLLEEVKRMTDSRILALLMHWEGTAPWAPPYVWPPFGGEEPFNEFADALHQNGDLLGVYCSGFGYTMKSNLIDYDKQDELKKRGLIHAMCADKDSIPKISKICTGQRSGYDICPSSELGKQILNEAYTPLFKSRADYAQILDQNHGGGQYLCFSENHTHAPTAGIWMTENMQELLTHWNSLAGNKLFGCESAAAEPFIGNLLYNDNRFELNYIFGEPVPFYAYVYHEYIRNFMGNQVCCPFPSDIDTMRYRLGYSFAIGDSMTLPITPDGDILSSWSTRDFTNFPDKEKTYRFIKNMTHFYNTEAKPYLYAGRMIKPKKLVCETVTFDVWDGFKNTYPALHTAAYEADGKRVQLVVNPWDSVKSFKIGEKELSVPSLSAILIDIE